MEPVYTIKRKRQQTDIDKTRCFFCHSSAGNLRIASSEGKVRTWTVDQLRRKFGDTNYIDVLDRLENLSEEDFSAHEIRWHKACYSTFSSESKLCRLRNKRQASAETSTSAKSDSCSNAPSAPTTRSSKTAIDWSLCMFCQAQGKKKT